MEWIVIAIVAFGINKLIKMGEEDKRDNDPRTSVKSARYLKKHNMTQADASWSARIYKHAQERTKEMVIQIYENNAHLYMPNQDKTKARGIVEKYWKDEYDANWEIYKTKYPLMAEQVEHFFKLGLLSW